jgi:hypothetical protein
MQLDLTDEETFALLNLLVDTIEADRYPMSPRISCARSSPSTARSAGCRQNSLRGSAAMHRRRRWIWGYNILIGRHPQCAKEGERLAIRLDPRYLWPPTKAIPRVKTAHGRRVVYLPRVGRGASRSGRSRPGCRRGMDATRPEGGGLILPAILPCYRLIVWCRDCRHQVEPDPAEMAERYGAEMTVPEWHKTRPAVGAQYFTRCGRMSQSPLHSTPERRPSEPRPHRLSQRLETSLFLNRMQPVVNHIQPTVNQMWAEC